MIETEPPNVLKLLSGNAKPDPSAEAMRVVMTEIQSGVAAKRLDIFSQIAWIKYRALVKAGFTEGQAIYLVGIASL